MYRVLFSAVAAVLVFAFLGSSWAAPASPPRLKANELTSRESVLA